MYNDRLLAAIYAEAEAADRLTRACARQGALVDSSGDPDYAASALRQSYGTALLTPSDMTSILRRLK